MPCLCVNSTSKAARVLSIVLLLFVVAAFSGCSVILAASSPKEPDLKVLRVGASRVQIEEQLGKPVTLYRTPSGDQATYLYLGSDEVSYRRAALYTVLNVATMGVAELIAAPVETLQNPQHKVVVLYNLNGRARSIRHIKREEAPLGSPEKLIARRAGGG